MVYKVYISTQEDNEMYASAAQQALFAINEIALTALSAQDVPILGQNRHNAARIMIQQADIFLGIYDSIYGKVPKGETQSHTEIEYETAVEYDKPRLIFVMDTAMSDADERQKAFIFRMQQNNVVTTFTDSDDLAAKIQVALDNYRQTRSHRRKLVPPNLSLRDRLPSMPGSSSQQQTDTDEPQTFDEQIERALEIANQEIEQIVRRALELHDAQSQVSEKKFEDFDNKIEVEPLWGEPLRRSQFQSDIFMVMPFRERFNGVFEDVIRPVAASLNLTIKRGDEFASTRGSIMQEVWAALNACKLVIVETTEINANVYYELGIAHTLGKPAILLTQTKDVQQLPFDIRHLRFLVYEDTIEGSADLAANLRQSIIWLLNDLDESSDA